MNKKQFYILQAFLKAGLSIFCISLLLWEDMSNNESGIFIAIALSVLFAYFSYNDYKTSKLANEQDIPYLPPANSSEFEKVSFYKRYIYLVLLHSHC